MDGFAEYQELLTDIQARTRKYAQGAALDWERSFSQQGTTLLNTITMSEKSSHPRATSRTIGVLQQFYSSISAITGTMGGGRRARGFVIKTRIQNQHSKPKMEK